MKIGVFDSGVGGLTVLEALRAEYPQIDFSYLGDTAHVPYGSKSPSHVTALSVAAAKTLQAEGIDLLVVACNTASSVALEAIRDALKPIPVVGVVEAGIEAALEAMAQLAESEDPFAISAPILVLATQATVRSKAYSQTLRKVLEPRLVPGRVPCPIIEQACPLLVPMIEEGWTDHPILHATIEVYVKPHRMSQPQGVALLGCTHYPWVLPALQKALPGWSVVNSATAVARSLRLSSSAAKGKGTFQWKFTDPEAVPEFATRVLRAG